MVLWLSCAACAGDPPVLETVAPGAASVGSAVTLTGSGFADVNDIGFALGADEVGFLTGVGSDDGARLTFTLPAELGACAYTQLDDDEACILIALPMPSGDTTLFVATEDGDSNELSFRVEP